MNDDPVYLPAEWHPHRATWIAWPHNRDTWPTNLAEAQQEMMALIRVIAEGETVCVIASGEHLDEARHHLKGISNLEFFDIPTNDAWIRDYGPMFVIHPDKTKSALSGNYNCWGEKYPPFDLDQQVAHRIAEKLGIRCARLELVLEGGAIDVNGIGAALTTRSCLLNDNRNPRMTAQQVETSLQGWLGIDECIWLPGNQERGGLARDDTDGHIDQMARFARPGVVCIARDHPDSEYFLSNRAALVEFPSWVKDIIEIPIPAIRLLNMPIPASYLNFYFCNRGVLVPQFGENRLDAIAADLIGEATGREVLPLASLNLTWGLGSFHCLTLQEPDGRGPE